MEILVIVQKVLNQSVLKMESLYYMKSKVYEKRRSSKAIAYY